MVTTSASAHRHFACINFLDQPYSPPQGQHNRCYPRSQSSTRVGLTSLDESDDENLLGSTARNLEEDDNSTAVSTIGKNLTRTI